MNYNFSTICAIAKVLGFPEVGDDRIKALLAEGRRVRWREAKYERLYMEMVEDCIAQHLTWEDCKEAAMVFWVKIQEQKYEDAKEKEVRARNRVIELLKRGQYDEAEKLIIHIKEDMLWVAANIRVEIENTKSKYPNADWNF